MVKWKSKSKKTLLQSTVTIGVCVGEWVWQGMHNHHHNWLSLSLFLKCLRQLEREENPFKWVSWQSSESKRESSCYSLTFYTSLSLLSHFYFLLSFPPFPFCRRHTQGRGNVDICLSESNCMCVCCLCMLVDCGCVSVCVTERRKLLETVVETNEKWFPTSHFYPHTIPHLPEVLEA